MSEGGYKVTEPQEYTDAVREAYKLGTYTDTKGQVWRRGMDGWFLEVSDKSSLLVRHHDFVEYINKEHSGE